MCCDYCIMHITPGKLFGNFVIKQQIERSCMKVNFQDYLKHELDFNPFLQGQINNIQKLWRPKSESSSAHNTYVTQAGSHPSVFSSFPIKSTPWIIDSGASDLMTILSHLFHSYILCSHHNKVHIADESF